MDRDTGLLLNKWAEGKFLNVPNELFDCIKKSAKNKKTLAGLVLAYLLHKKLPEVLQEDIRLIELSGTSLRSFRRHSEEAIGMVDSLPKDNLNYTKIKMETVLRLLQEKKITPCDKILFWEIAKQNCVFRLGHKARSRLDNYCMWFVYTKHIRNALNGIMSERQIINSIESLSLNGFIIAERIKNPKNPFYPKWKLQTIDMVELAVNKIENQDEKRLQKLTEGFLNLFEKYQEKWTMNEVQELVQFFLETKHRGGKSWKSPLKAIEKDLKTETRYLLKQFYQWRYMRHEGQIKKENEERESNNKWLREGGFESVKQLAKESNDGNHIDNKAD